MGKRQKRSEDKGEAMLRKLIKTLLAFILCAIVATVIGWYAPVLLCDVLRLPLGVCR